MVLIAALNVTRVKGVVRTDKGSYSFNKAGSDFNCNKVTHSKDNRIELIDTDQDVLNNITSEQLLMLNRGYL